MCPRPPKPGCKEWSAAPVNAALNKALQHPDTAAYFRQQGVQSVGGSADEFGRFIRAEAAKWGALAKAVGVKLD